MQKSSPVAVLNDSRPLEKENLHRRELKQANGKVKQYIPGQRHPSGFAPLRGDTYGRGGAEALHQNKLTRGVTWERRSSAWTSSRERRERRGVRGSREEEKRDGRKSQIRQTLKRGGGGERQVRSYGERGRKDKGRSGVWLRSPPRPGPLETFQRTLRYLIKASREAGSAPTPAISLPFLPTNAATLNAPLAD